MTTNAVLLVLRTNFPGPSSVVINDHCDEIIALCVRELVRFEFHRQCTTYSTYNSFKHMTLCIHKIVKGWHELEVQNITITLRISEPYLIFDSTVFFLQQGSSLCASARLGLVAPTCARTKNSQLLLSQNVGDVVSHSFIFLSNIIENAISWVDFLCGLQQNF